MPKKFMWFSTTMLVALALSAAACGKSDSKSPVAATPSTAPVTLPPGPANGATVSGTVVASAATSSVRTMAATALTVTVLGTSVTATVNGGTFTLQSVPPGDVTLVFSGGGVNAQLVITGVTAQEQIRITVNLHGTTADVDDDEREKPDNSAEIEGKIVMINATARTLVVGSHNKTVSVPSGTPIHHGGTAIVFSALVVGERGHIKATMRGTTFVATDGGVQTG